MIKSLFPTFLYDAVLFSPTDTRAKGTSRLKKELNKDLKTECLKFAQIDEQGQAWSAENYRGGYTSYGSLSEMPKISTTFEILEKQIDVHVKKFVRHLQMDIRPQDLKMTSCWINIMPANVIHTMHLHPLSVISGTYYVQTPKDCSSLKLEDPRMNSFMASPPRKHNAKEFNQRYYSLAPQEGHVVLFESWLRHEVPQNNSSKERISISFNYDWV